MEETEFVTWIVIGLIIGVVMVIARDEHDNRMTLCEIVAVSFAWPIYAVGKCVIMLWKELKE